MRGRGQVCRAKKAPADPFGWIGLTLDTQFVVEAVASQGGFGIVYRGLHLGLDVPVAIKCLKLPTKLGEADRRGFLIRLRKEACLLHRLSRQTISIVQALHVGAATAPSGVWTPYLVMEWLDGETLEDNLFARKMSGKAPRGLNEAIRLLASGAMALSIAHEENVAHLDLKPANLIFTKIRGGTLLKVLDFGVAKTFVNTPGMGPSITQPSRGMQAFTPQYGAPEQFSPQYGVPGPWTDVFAMALLLIEVASGHRALEGTNVDQLYFAAIDERNRSRMISLIPGVGEEVKTVLLRALNVDARLRFRTLGEMWTALNEAQGEISDIRMLPMPLDDMEEHGSQEESLVEGQVDDATTKDPPVERAWEEMKGPRDMDHDTAEEAMRGLHDTGHDTAEGATDGQNEMADDSGDKPVGEALHCTTGQQANVNEMPALEGIPLREILAGDTTEGARSSPSQGFFARSGGILVRWRVLLPLVIALLVLGAFFVQGDAPLLVARSMRTALPRVALSPQPTSVAAPATAGATPLFKPVLPNKQQKPHGSPSSRSPIVQKPVTPTAQPLTTSTASAASSSEKVKPAAPHQKAAFPGIF